MTNTESFSTPETAAVQTAASGPLAGGWAHASPHGLLDGTSLFLDVDGTLVDLAERPDLVRISPLLPDLLARLASRLNGRVALVSGRGAQEVAALIDVPGLTIAGSHGAEILSASGRLWPPRPAVLDEALAAINAFAARHPRLLVEDKPQGVALHYRRLPGAAQTCQTLAADLARRLGLRVQPGKMVVELLPRA
jgi:trehalose 6-phosphate phosphatase